MKAKNIKYSILDTQSRRNAGVTLIELMITIVVAMLVFAGIGVAMVDSIKSFPKMYERTEGNIVNDAYVSRATFDRICRKASVRLAEIDSGGTFVVVYSYNDANAVSLNRYAQFRTNGTSLLVDYGIYNASTKAKTLTSTETLATTVDTSKLCKFAVDGSSVIMVLGLKKGDQGMTVTSTAVRHN
jgi:hypothetical protein